MKWLTYTMLFVMAASGCSYSKQKNSQSAIPPITAYSANQLTYSSIYQQVLRTNCIGCHGNSGNVNLQDYGSVKKYLSRIYRSTIRQRRMPPKPKAPLTPYQLGLLNAWIQKGAPNGPSELPPLVPTFESIKMHILEPKCIDCHAPGKSAPGIPLVTRADLLNPQYELVSEIPEESGIILSMRDEDPRKVMPPEKYQNGQATGYSRLSEQEINVMLEWIKRVNQGAID